MTETRDMLTVLSPSLVHDQGLLASDEVARLIDYALAEDIGPGDVTTSAIVAQGCVVQATVVVKQKAVVAGIAILAQTFKRVDPTVDVLVCLDDGNFI